jgi:hypothetical protein
VTTEPLAVAEAPRHEVWYRDSWPWWHLWRPPPGGEVEWKQAVRPEIRLLCGVVTAGAVVGLLALLIAVAESALRGEASTVADWLRFLLLLPFLPVLLIGVLLTLNGWWEEGEPPQSVDPQRLQRLLDPTQPLPHDAFTLASRNHPKSSE